MSKDFEQIGHKNLELLRFYINKDIKKIENKIENNESNLLGYFLASLVDIFIVVLFNDIFNLLIKPICKNIALQIIIKIVCISSLLILFFVVVTIVKKVLEHYKEKSRVRGDRVYQNSAEQQDNIDRFDNVACDGLLICQNYIQKYQTENESYIREFYLYEIIHHLEKSRLVFSEIYKDKVLYLPSEENDYSSELLDTFRINNFIVFANAILQFLIKNIPENPPNNDLKTRMANLKSGIQSWEQV